MRACSGAGAAAALWLAAACGAASSGFYADNGAGQTVVQHVLSVHERNQLQLHILDLLGLPARPRVVRPNLATSASRFLLAVYSHRSPSPVPAGASPVFRLAPADLRAVDASDVVLSFASRGHHAGAVRHERGKRLWFDVSEVPAGETIVGSELRLYHMASNPGSAASFTLSLYQLTAVGNGCGTILCTEMCQHSRSPSNNNNINMVPPISHKPPNGFAVTRPRTEVPITQQVGLQQKMQPDRLGSNR